MIHLRPTRRPEVMPSYEVTIATEPANSVALTFVVDACGWLEAWHEALRTLGELPPADAHCVMAPEGAFEVRCPSSDRIFRVRRREVPRPLLGDTAPQPAASQAGLVSRPGVTRPPGGERTTAPGMPAAGAAQRSAPRHPAERRLASTGDPAARSLRTDERARLRAARTVADARASDDVAAGVDAPAGRSLRRAAPQEAAARHTVDTDKALFGAAERNAAFHLMAPEHAPLPQQFRTIGGPTRAGSSEVGAVKDAVSTVWQHIPCQLVQAFRHRDDGGIEVVAARGDHEREVLARRVHSAEGFPQLRGGRATRVKFAEERGRLKYSAAPSEPAFALQVRSAMCVPITLAGAPWAVMVVVNAPREAGFTEGELRALCYLAQTIERALTRPPDAP